MASPAWALGEPSDGVCRVAELGGRADLISVAFCGPQGEAVGHDGETGEVREPSDVEPVTVRLFLNVAAAFADRVPPTVSPPETTAVP